MVKILTELNDRLRRDVERRLDAQDRRLDARDSMLREALSGIASVLPAGDRSVLGEAALRFIDGAPAEFARNDAHEPKVTDGSQPTELHSEKEPISPWDDDGKVIRWAWDIAVGVPCGMARGQQWIALRELYTLARGVTSCEDEALTLYMYWAEKYKADNADDSMAVRYPNKLLLRPTACPAELPEDRRAPERWTSRARVRMAWKAALEERRERSAGVQREEGEEPTPPESGWDAGRDDGEPSNGTGV